MHKALAALAALAFSSQVFAADMNEPTVPTVPPNHVQTAQVGQGNAQMFLQCTRRCEAQQQSCEERVRRNGYYPGADADLRRCVEAFYQCNSGCDRYR